MFSAQEPPPPLPPTYSDAEAQSGYGQPGMQAGYSQPGMQAGYSQPGMQAGYSQPGMHVGYGQPGIQSGYGQPGMQAELGQPEMQAGYSQPGMQAGYGQPGMQAGLGQPGMQAGYSQPSYIRKGRRRPPPPRNIPGIEFGEVPVTVICPVCQLQGQTVLKEQLSYLALYMLILFVALWLWFLVCIPLCVPQLQDTVHYCPHCWRQEVGRATRDRCSCYRKTTM